MESSGRSAVVGLVRVLLAVTSCGGSPGAGGFLGPGGFPRPWRVPRSPRLIGPRTPRPTPVLSLVSHRPACVPPRTAYPPYLAALCITLRRLYQGITDTKMVISYHKWTPEVDGTAEIEARRLAGWRAGMAGGTYTATDSTRPCGKSQHIILGLATCFMCLFVHELTNSASVAFHLANYCGFTRSELSR